MSCRDERKQMVDGRAVIGEELDTSAVRPKFMLGQDCQSSEVVGGELLLEKEPLEAVAFNASPLVSEVSPQLT